ncbi:MAG: PEP-CTERM sorting domain-containing protein [Cyanobacteria bacterium J06659_2]
MAALNASAAECEAGTVTALGLGSSSSCIGAFSGNDTGSGNALLNELETGVFDGITEWEILDKSDSGSNQTTADNGSTSGNWNFNDSIEGPFVVSLKASNSWSAYYFDTYESYTSLSGTFETVGVSTNGRGNPRALSHLTFARAVVTPTPPDDNSVATPEPMSTAAFGLFAVGAFRVLKKKTGAES